MQYVMKTTIRKRAHIT